MNAPNTWTPDSESIWSRRLVQAGRITRFEFRRTLSARRWLPSAVAAFGPLAIVLLALVLGGRGGRGDARGEIAVVFATVFQTYMLRLAIFFAAMDTFSRLYRGELMEKTLHYYLLVPARREIIILGKYLAGLVQSALLFVPAVILTYFAMFMLGGARVVETQFSNGPGVTHAAAYAAIALLALVGYGAVFMLFGLISRNPIVPAVLFLGWESVNVFLPATFQKISIIHYLQSICPVPLPFGPFAVLTEPTSPWLSVPGMLGVTVLFMGLAAFLMRRAEVTYGGD
jgi:ABC-type transport system involved in multi-copper enzyme maturation permease subunit